MTQLKQVFLRNRHNNKRSLMVYLNSGDPSLEITERLIGLCARLNVDAIELGIPFKDSFSDGNSVNESHQRALANQVELEQVLKLVKKVRLSHDIAIVLLVDFSHTVKSRGLRQVVKQCAESGANGLMIHGLPPLYFNSYVALTNEFTIQPVFSLYPNSKAETIKKISSLSRGFIYLVSQYGKTGAPINFKSDTIKSYYDRVKSCTDQPILAGFGIKTPSDMKSLFSSTPIDGVIVGSSICQIIKDNLLEPQHLLDATEKYITSLTHQKSINYPKDNCIRNSLEATT